MSSPDHNHHPIQTPPVCKKRQSHRKKTTPQSEANLDETKPTKVRTRSTNGKTQSTNVRTQSAKARNRAKPKPQTNCVTTPTKSGKVAIDNSLCTSHKNKTPQVSYPSAPTSKMKQSANSLKAAKNTQRTTSSSTTAKQRFITTCVKQLTDSLPCQTFSFIMPVFFKPELSQSSINNHNNDSHNNNDHSPHGKNDVQIRKRPEKKSRKTQSDVKKDESQQPEPHEQHKSHHESQSQHESQHPPSDVTLDRLFYDCIPIHPSVNIVCSFCTKQIAHDNINHFISFPHTRNRHSFVCDACYVGV